MKRIALALSMSVLLGLPLRGAASDSVLPDSPVGRRARAYLEAFHSGEAAVEAFLEANLSAQARASRPVSERLSVYRQMREEHGTLTPVRLARANDHEVEILARTKFDRHLHLTFLFEPEPPHHFLGLRIVDSGPDEGTAPAETVERMGEGEAIEAWREHLDELAKADRFSGAVLLARGDRVLFKAAYGEASRTRHVPNRADTRFNLGSINKIFTKLAIAQLVEQGKVRLDDTIDRYLKDYPREVASKVTVRHLLMHRGGVGDIFGQAYDRADRSALRRNGDWIPLFRDTPLAFEPGSQQQYSNGGYVLLGAIIEKASGEDYFDYVRRHITGPLGMKDTEHSPAGDDPRIASGYTRERLPGVAADASGWADNTPSRPYRGSAAGGGYSTLDDLLRFTQAIRQSKLLRRETLTPEFREFLVDERGELGLGIGGGAPGIDAAVEAMGPYTIIVLANLDPPAAGMPAQWLSQRLPHDGPVRERRMIGAGGGHSGARVEGGSPGSEPGGMEVERTAGGERVRSTPGRVQAPERSSIPARGVDVPMLKADHLPAVHVMVNGQGPFLFGIDTGGQGSARIDSALAARLHLPVVGQVRAGDPSGRNARLMNLVKVDALEIGGARFEGISAAVRDYHERRVGQPIDGILGFGLFQKGLLTLDYPGARVRVEEGELPSPDGAEIVPCRMERGIPSIALTVGPLTVDADIDAGAMGGFMLPTSMIDQLTLAAPPKVVGKARTVSNEFEIQEARLDGTVKLGGYEFAAATLGFQPVMPMANVGSRVLRDFIVTFDQKNGRVRFRKPV